MKLRRWLALFSVCVLLCGAFPLSASAGVDKSPLKNGDFETGNMENWDVLSDGVSASKAAAYDGVYGCLLTGDGGWDDLLSITFTVLPDYSYTLSFWYKAQPMGVSWYLTEGEDDIRLARGWAGATQWTQVVKEFTPTTDTVRLLLRESGSHVAELVYLDCVTVTLNPCKTHIYDNECDTTCNICDEVRTVGDHLYDHDCDIYCNYCGFERAPSGKHTYDFPCATLCNYCGAPRVGEGEHTYDDVCDTTCNFCSEVREVPHFYDYPCEATCTRCGTVREDIAEELHTYDDIYDADCNDCGHLRIPTPKPMERLRFGGANYAPASEIGSKGVGVAFRFFLEAKNTQTRANHSYISKSATVERYNNGVGYKLIQMGAVMSNKADAVLDLELVDGNKVLAIKAGYLCKVTEDSISFAVRIVNIPDKGKNTLISARPYYIYSDGKEEIVVYGETVARSYNQLAAG